MPVALLAAVAAMLTTNAATALDVVAGGLHQPRGLAFSDDGTLYVSESGTGVPGPNASIAAIVSPLSAHPYVKRVVTGLISNGEEGPDGLSIHDDAMYVITSASTKGMLNPPRGVPVTDTNPPTFGRLLKFNASGNFRELSNVGDQMYDWSQSVIAEPYAGDFPDSNPYGLLVTDDHKYVADAGTNTVLEVMRDGSLKRLAYLPNPSPSGIDEFPWGDGIPTCIAQGRDGLLYVGTLHFLPSIIFNAPMATVYRFNPRASANGMQFLTAANVWADGFWPITGCGFGPGGFYVTSFFTQTGPGPFDLTGGEVVKIAVNRNGSAGARTHYGVGELNNPNFFAVGPDHKVYVSNNSTSPDGQVVRFDVCGRHCDD